MTLHETIRRMREFNNDEQFATIISVMLEKASRGLIEGVTAEDINRELRALEIPVSESTEPDNHDYELLFPLMSELNEAIKEFGYLDSDNSEILKEENENNFTFGEYIEEQDDSLNKTIGELLS